MGGCIGTPCRRRGAASSVSCWDGWSGMAGSGGGDKNCRVGLTFGAGDLSVAETLKPILLTRGMAGRCGWSERARGVWHLSYHGRFFIDFFPTLGVRAVEADKKVVPEAMFTAPRDAVIGFLQALFTADGTVRDNPKSNSSWIALTSKSRDLLRGVQLLLLNLGIKSQILDRSRPARGGSVRRPGPNAESRPPPTARMASCSSSASSGSPVIASAGRSASSA